jgi:hypothetical protein
VLALSRFGDVPYFLGRGVFDFVTGRRGMDINQPSRLKTYAQLKLLLSLNESIDPGLRSEITDRLKTVSLNPMENSIQAERSLAKEQYAVLLNYATRSDGLAAKLARDRRAEMTQLAHDRPARIFFRVANIISLGKYVHREEASSDIPERLDLARQRDYHTRFLREVAASGYAPGHGPKDQDTAPKIEVTWNLEEVRSSLKFMSEHGEPQDSKAVAATSKIFARTNDDETRRACLAALSQINNSRARAELLRISVRLDLDQELRDLSGQYLAKGHRVVEQTSTNNSSTGSPDRE